MHNEKTKTAVLKHGQSCFFKHTGPDRRVMVKTLSSCQRYARVQSLCGDIDGNGKEFMVKVKDLIPESQ